MSIWNKVLLWLIGLSSLGLLIMAARAFQAHAYWMDTAQKLEKSIARVKDDNRLLLMGDNENPGINKERVLLHKLLVDRPRVWMNCVAQVPKGAATINVAIDMPGPHGIIANNTIYAFEEPSADAPGRYLGEFNVTAAAEKQLTLAPAYPLTPSDLMKVESTKQPWILYDALPQDNHEAFAGLTEDQLKTFLPPETLAEFAKDGKPATEQDSKDRIDEQKNYVRQLRDYSQLLDFYRRQYTILFDETEATTRDKALVDESLADAQRQVQFFQNLSTELKTQLGKTEKERDAVAKFAGDRLEGGVLKMLKDKLASIEGAINRMIEENKAMAGQIAQKQLEATRQIDARTRAMAQSAAGGEK
jgi:hypothetical protein